MESHDHNFKNVFLDFPKEALEWLAPETFEVFGGLKDLEFVRQEPKKRKLKDAHLALDMPILFNFESGQVLLWLVEFQEDKRRFSIYRLLRYTTDLMEAYPRATLIPTVLFTRRGKWRKNVVRKIGSHLGGRTYLHFEYQMVRLFDFNARDYYENPNPIVKILMPRMNYTPEERPEVIRQAYLGLYQLVTPMLFDKYVDFIDVYAGVQEDEREELYLAIAEKEETTMLAQYIKEKGFKEGVQQGIQQGIREGIMAGLIEGIELGIGLRFGPRGLKLMEAVRQIGEVEQLKAVKEAVRTARNLSDFEAAVKGGRAH